MNRSEVVSYEANIKILGIGADGCSLASNVLPRVPHVHVFSLPNQADKNDEELAKILADTHLLFIATDITDAANQLNVEWVVRLARAKGVLVVGIALPIESGATERTVQAWNSNVDALLMGDPEKLCTELQTAAYEVAAILNEDGHVSIDFEDVRSILSMPGVVRVGTSKAAGPDRAQRAALDVIQDINLTQANGLMVLLSGAKGCLRLSESRQVLTSINSNLPESAHLIFGATYDNSLGDQLRVTVLVSGLPYPCSA